jgi:hypothetical protein
MWRTAAAAVYELLRYQRFAFDRGAEIKPYVSCSPCASNPPPRRGATAGRARGGLDHGMRGFANPA